MYRRRTDGKIVFENGNSIFCFGGRGSSRGALPLEATDSPEVWMAMLPLGETDGEKAALLSAARLGVEAEFCWPNMGIDVGGDGWCG